MRTRPTNGDRNHTPPVPFPRDCPESCAPLGDEPDFEPDFDPARHLTLETLGNCIADLVLAGTGPAPDAALEKARDTVAMLTGGTMSVSRARERTTRGYAIL